MKRLSPLFLAIPVIGSMLLTATEAAAFCGVVEESAQHMNATKASRTATKRVNAKVKSLKKQYGKKLALDQRQASCVGGALAIDASGNETVGPSSCTVTQSFCVNP